MSLNAADTLDWSPSGISCAEDDDGCGRFVPSSSCSDVSAASDIKGASAAAPALEGMTSLLTAMQELATSNSGKQEPLQNHGSKRIPGSHPIPGLSLTGNVASVELGAINANTQETEESTLENEQERTAIHRPTTAHGAQGLNTTPPVKDSGPSAPASSEQPQQMSLQDSGKKLSEMRSLLRALEQRARSSSASSSSRIPRRSIKFNSTAKTDAVLESEGSQKERLREELAAEREKCRNLEQCNETLEARVRELAARLDSAEETDARKEAAFRQIKQQWTLVSQKLAAEQEEALRREQAAVAEGEALRGEMAEAKKQISVCEEELGRALGLASEFRRKVEEDERVKLRLGEELAAERRAGREAEDRARKALADAAGLGQELQRAKAEYEASLGGAWASKEECERRISKLLSSREKETSQLNYAKAELEGEREAKAGLHAFYQGQIETILGEKVRELQEYVSQLESAFRAEKEEAVAEVTARAERERKELRRVASELERQKASLRAARTEADCLREQLRNAEAAGQSRRTASVAAGGALSSDVRSPSPSANALLKVQNLLYPDSSEPEREMLNNQRALKSDNLQDEAAMTLTTTVISNKEVSSFSSNNSLAKLTQEEREEVIQQFVRQFLEANPSAVHDASLMSGLNSMAVKMAEEEDFDRTKT